MTVPTQLPWTISRSAERVQLDPPGRAEATFTVHNNGPVDQRVVLDVVPSENADRSWFTVIEPQRLIGHGASATFVVQLAVPAGTPAGTCWLAARAYSADVAPEESSVASDRVAFEVAASKPPLTWWQRWWWLIAVAVLAVAVIGVVAFLLLRSDEDPPPPGPGAGGPAPTVVRKAEAITLQQTNPVDFDEVVVGGPAASHDVQFEATGPTEPRFLKPVNGALLAKIGPTDRPTEQCAAAEPSGDRIGVNDWRVGEVLCVRTNAGRLSVVILRQLILIRSLPPQPARLQVSITTFEPPEPPS